MSEKRGTIKWSDMLLYAGQWCSWMIWTRLSSIGRKVQLKCYDIPVFYLLLVMSPFVMILPTLMFDSSLWTFDISVRGFTFPLVKQVDFVFIDKYIFIDTACYTKKLCWSNPVCSIIRYKISTHTPVHTHTHASKLSTLCFCLIRFLSLSCFLPLWLYALPPVWSCPLWI